jgi:23S rRNA (cytosine1962-C5)-methyltransferase
MNKFSAEAEFITGDVFNYFEKCTAEKKRFDLIIIDPPAFAKNKKNLPKAKKGYEKLNRMALDLLPDGGILATSSCSYHLSEEDFRSVLSAASARSGRNSRLLYFGGASLDHPKLPAMPETSYLKFAILTMS